MSRYAASRVLLASVDDVWTFLSEPYHLADWWPNISGVEPDRRGFAPGARWRIRGSDVLTTGGTLPMWADMLRRPGSTGTLLITDVVSGVRFSFQLTNERIDAEVELEPLENGLTRVVLTVEAPWASMRRSFPRRALDRLYDLVQTAAE